MAEIRKENNESGTTFTYTKDGKTYELNYTADDKNLKHGTYRADNLFRRGQTKHVAAAIELSLQLGKTPTKEQYINYLDKIGMEHGRSDGAYRNVLFDINAFFRENSIETDIDGYITTPGLSKSSGHTAESARDDAFGDFYYRDNFSLEEGTTGRDTLDSLESGAANIAQQDLIMARTQFQSDALRQAQVVKNVTDQIKSERRARLRAGMSESQIANADMQMMMSNVNALNENAAMMNQNVLSAQANVNTSRDQAFLQWLESSAARGQVGAAHYASASANPNVITTQRMEQKYGPDRTKWREEDYRREYGASGTGTYDPPQ